MNEHRLTVCILLLMGAAYLAYVASQKDGDRVLVPEFQTEAQMMGLGVSAGMDLANPGSPLDMRISTHFWDPGVNSRDQLAWDQNRPIPTPHRYPCVPGGNISTVMHKGWSQFAESVPNSNDWFLNPPSASVL